MPGRGKRLLIVEDQEMVAMTIAAVVTRLNYDLVGSAPTSARAVELARLCQPDVVLLDFHLKGDANGADTALAIRNVCAAGIVFLTGSHDPDVASSMRAVGPAGIVFKPFRRTELAACLAVAAQICGDQTGGDPTGGDQTNPMPPDRAATPSAITPWRPHEAVR